MALELITGDTFDRVVDLYVNGQAYEVPSGSRVEAMLRDNDLTLIAPTVQSSQASGANWPVGRVAILFTSMQTDAIDLGTPEQINATLEIQIVGDSTTETFIYDDVLVRQGYIPAFEGLSPGAYIVTGTAIQVS